jgi:hypothetical protein
MAIKQQHVLTKQDFEAALVTLRLSVSEVARETGIPRHVVSHFRNYSDGMKPEQLAKLRDYLEDKGVEFADEAEIPAASKPPGEQPSTQQPLKMPIILSDDGLTQRTALVCRHFFIDERFTEDQLKSAGKCIEKSFEQAKELLGVELVSEWASNDYDEATDAKLRELWGHLASIGLVTLLLQGRLLINKNDQERLLTTSLSEGDKPELKTLGDLLFNTYSEAVAVINPSGQVEQAEAEKDEVTS